MREWGEWEVGGLFHVVARVDNCVAEIWTGGSAEGTIGLTGRREEAFDLMANFFDTLPLHSLNTPFFLSELAPINQSTFLPSITNLPVLLHLLKKPANCLMFIYYLLPYITYLPTYR